MENQTRVTEFVLLGLSDVRWLQILLFFVLLLIYLLTLMANIIIITITLLDRHLQTPMYFLLRNFALVEVGLTSAAIPKALFNLASGTKTISMAGCFTECFFYVTVGTAEFFLLASMSFDRYVAICKPLHYASIMNSRFCGQLVLGCWVTSFLYVITPLVLLVQLPFCTSNSVDHFFCDIVAVLNVSCTDTHKLRLMIFLLATGSILSTFAITIISYINILSTVLRIPSASGRQKAFSTCVSHFAVASITYGSCIFIYIKPAGSSGVDFSKSVALLNNVVSSLLNPFIYSLRNKQVKEALRNTASCTILFFKNSQCLGQ
ncbi:olfactory receptor 6C74-like [Alligator mississippiensis]|uniref:olfactory receptor 6C74-like n=1 Tax=Alligator mississippiensis TaxID=8496 RepID=UPI0028773C61|nr:olfactory receptor 6C74-like [Alligator mississippiensis]